MSKAFNKITFAWSNTEIEPNIINNPNWIINPVFTDEEFAMKIGPYFWIYPGGNIIATPMQSDYDSLLLAKEQNDMWTNIQNERDRRKLNGGYKVGNYWYHSDNTSRIQQIALFIMGASMPNNIMWKTMSGDFVLMTPMLAGQIFQSAAASDMTLFSVAESKKKAMLASSNPTEYDFMSGWPRAFGE